MSAVSHRTGAGRWHYAPARLCRSKRAGPRHGDATHQAQYMDRATVVRYRTDIIAVIIPVPRGRQTLPPVRPQHPACTRQSSGSMPTYASAHTSMPGGTEFVPLLA